MIRRLIIASICLSLFCLASQSYAQTKIDPYFDSLHKGSQFKALSISKIPNSNTSDPSVEVFIKTNDLEQTSGAVLLAGGRVHTAFGKIITANVPSKQLDVIAQSDNVIFIEAAKPINLSNDVAAEEIGLTEVHAGYELPQAFSGKGIILGIVDTGIDYTHDDFTDNEGNSRVLAIWDQSKYLGKGPVEISNTFGTECDAESIASGFCPLTDFDGHGTHVASIAAGRDDKYGGVAPDANIIVVKYDAKLDLETGYADAIFSTKICQAAYYVFAKAEKLGMPAVVNLSLGTHIGAHDGTSLFEECLGALVGEAGKALVAAGGNEYSGDQDYTGIHTGFELSESKRATNFVIHNASSDGMYYIDVWGSPGSVLNVGLAVHDGEPTGEPKEYSGLTDSGATNSGSFKDGNIDYMINATETESVLNGKPHVGVLIAVDPNYNEIEELSFDLVVKGSGSFDAWLFPDKPARTIQFTAVSGTEINSPWQYIAGDRMKSVAIPSTSPDVISVVGYATRNRWTTGMLTWIFNGQELGEILNFSSSGPTADPEFTGQKPEIAAPGGMIAAAKSSHAQIGSEVTLDDGEHFLQAGTSMAAPFVSGTIALMFEANPNFTQADVLGFLIDSAYADMYVGSVPNNRWGYGKLDALRAMELAVNGNPSGYFDSGSLGSIGAQSQADSSGQSSCQLISTEHRTFINGEMLVAVFLLLALGLIKKTKAARTEKIV